MRNDQIYFIYILKTQTTRVLLTTIKIVVVHNTMKHNSTVLLIYTYIYMLFLNTVLITHQVIRFKISSLFTEEKQQLWPQPPFFFSELTLLTIHPFSPTSEMSHISPTVSFQLHFFCFHYFTPLQYIYFSPPFLDFCNLTLPQSGSHLYHTPSGVHSCGTLRAWALAENTHFSSTTVITYIYTKESTVWHLKFWPHAV